MSDYTTRLAIWSSQGRRFCKVCGEKVYGREEGVGYLTTEHVGDNIFDKSPAHMPIAGSPTHRVWA